MRYSISSSLVAVALLAGLPAPVVHAQTPIAVAEIKREEPVDFEKEVLPILKRNCLACHNATEAESDLVLETPQSILKGGALGPAAEAGKGAESYLIKVASHAEDPVMPPKDNKANAKNLTPQELGLIKLWIDQGATGTVTGGKVVFTPLPPGVNPIYATAITADGQYAACGRANQIFIYHVPTGREVGRLTDPELISSGLYSQPGVAHRDIVQSLAFNPEGTLLASGGFQVVKLWQRPENVQQHKFAAGAEVAATAVSPDRKWLAAAAGKEIALFDLAAGKPGPKLQGHGENVTSLGFSPDSAKLYSGSLDKTVRVWTLADGKEAGKLETPQPVAALTVVGEGKQVATGGGDEVIRLWNVEDLSKPAEELLASELKGHTKPVTSLVTMASDKTQIVSGSEDGTARQWNTANAQAVRTVTHGAPITAVAVSADGQRYATASANNTARLWNATNAQQVAEVKGDIRAQAVVARLNSDINLAQTVVNTKKAANEAATKDEPVKAEAAKKADEAVAAADKALAEKKGPADKAKADNEAAAKVLAAADEEVKKATDAVAKAVEALNKKADDEGLKKAKADADKALADAQQKQRDADTKFKATQKPLEDADKALAEAQRTLDSAKKAQEIAQADLKKAKDLIPASQKEFELATANHKKLTDELAAAQKTVAESEKPFKSIAFSPDSLELAVGGDSNLVHTYSAADGSPLAVQVGHAGSVSSLAYIDNTVVASGSADKNVVVWQTSPEWQLVRSIGTDESPLADRVIALSFSPDGKQLATGGGEPSRSGELKIWNVANGKLIREIVDAHSDTVFSLEYSPAGDMLASGAADKFMKVWDVAKGTMIRSFEGHTHHVLGVTWKFDSTVLATCGADNVIKIWTFDTGEQQRTIAGFNKQLTAIKFVGATVEVVSSAGDKQVHRRRSDNGGTVRTYAGGTDYMYAVAVSADGKIVISGGEDSILRVWNGDTGAVIRNFEPPKPAPASETAAK